MKLSANPHGQYQDELNGRLARRVLNPHPGKYRVFRKMTGLSFALNERKPGQRVVVFSTKEKRSFGKWISKMKKQGNKLIEIRLPINWHDNYRAIFVRYPVVLSTQLASGKTLSMEEAI